MSIIKIESEIPAGWARSLDLDEIGIVGGDFIVRVNDEIGCMWEIKFISMVSVKITSEEYFGGSGEIIFDGALYVMQNSVWVDELNIKFRRDDVFHYILFCYDQVIEVVSVTHEVLRRG